LANLQVPCKVARMDTSGLNTGPFPVRGATDIGVLRQEYVSVSEPLSKRLQRAGADRLGVP